MSLLSKLEKQACQQARNFAEEYTFSFASEIAKGMKPTEAHKIALELAATEFPIVDECDHELVK